MPEWHAVAGETRSAVGQEADALLIPDGYAAVRPRTAAVGALAALRREERHDVIARSDERHAWPDLLNDPGPLVTEDAVGVSGRVGARGGIEIGVAYAAGLESHQRLAGFRVCELDLLNDERLPELLSTSNPDFNRSILIN